MNCGKSDGLCPCGGVSGQGGVGGGVGGVDWNREEGLAPPCPSHPGESNDSEQIYQVHPVQDNCAPFLRKGMHWAPPKDSSNMAMVERKIKNILNKLSRDNFAKLSADMCDILVLNHGVLLMVVNMMYERAVSEPLFSDLHALCVRLLYQAWAQRGNFIKIIESDEDPLVEQGSAKCSESVSYRWSNDVNISDAEVVGPFENVEQCIDAALSDENIEPIVRGDMELTLHRLLIKHGTFIKILHSFSTGKFYSVFFPIAEATKHSQQISLEAFTSEIDAQNHANKTNSFKRSFLNKCEDEFNKMDKNKNSLAEKEKVEDAEALESRKLHIQEQMLGNIKFLGELYNIRIIKKKVMQCCIHSLLNLHEGPGGGLCPQVGVDGEMIEGDHEAVIHLFRTIGRNMKKLPFSKFYVEKIKELSEDSALCSRLRFGYSSLIDSCGRGGSHQKGSQRVITGGHSGQGGCLSGSGNRVVYRPTSHTSRNFGPDRNNNADISLDKLRIRAICMRQEWLHDLNEENLLESIDDVIATPDAGLTIVQVNDDYAAIDCKKIALQPIIEMIVLLYKKKRVKASHVQAAIRDVVEFVDSFEHDNPQIYDYIGDMFAAFYSMEVLTVQWLCECTRRVSNLSCRSRVIYSAMKSVRQLLGDGAVHSCLTCKRERSALAELLGPAKLQELKSMLVWQEQGDGQDDAIRHVLASPELLGSIVCFLVLGEDDHCPRLIRRYKYDSFDYDHHEARSSHDSWPKLSSHFPRILGKLSVVSKSFHVATSENGLWREMCHGRWKRVYGFQRRWEEALYDYSNSEITQQVGFWKRRFVREELYVKELIHELLEEYDSDSVSSDDHESFYDDDLSFHLFWDRDYDSDYYS